MKKSLLKKRIDEISHYLKGERAKEAINILRSELVDYKTEDRQVCDIEHFQIPEEVMLHKGSFALFTDGACRGNPGPGSWAYLVQGFEGDMRSEDAGCSELTTNNKMELMAIIQGLKSLIQERSSRVFIYTDSKYAVDGMNSWVAGWKKRNWKKADKKRPENLELWQELDQLSQKMNLSFHWIKGHAGHPQNEYVDALANKALDDNGL